MPTATIVQINLDNPDGAQLQIQLDDLELADKSKPQYTLNFRKADYYGWLEAHPNGTLTDYLQELLTDVISQYQTTQNLLKPVSLGTSLKW